MPDKTNKKGSKKRRKKSTRHRGTHTHGRGAKKKARGKGHRGGIGNAGTGKRADQKKTKVLKEYGNKYFRRDKAIRAGRVEKIKIMSLSVISDNILSFVKKGLAKGSRDKGEYELDLKVYKIIGDNDIKLKLKIHARAASKGAKKAIKESGGEIIIEGKIKKTKDDS